MRNKRILVIAGSDSSGGAGLEADQKVIAAHCCYAMTATTALTAQNTQMVGDIHHVPPAFVRKQIDACIDDIGVDVVKIGMLASRETVQTVANALHHHGVSTTVVDPVMVATSGARLLSEDAVEALRVELLPLTTILTPNIPEAMLLLENAGLPAVEVKNVDDLKRVAVAVQKLGPRYVLLKGGHIPLRRDGTVSTSDTDRQLVVNILAGNGDTVTFKNEYLESKDTHGTGCSLASALASNLACGFDIRHAVRAATRYVEAGIKTSPGFGKGNGPINHFHSIYTMPFAPGHFIEYLMNRDDVQDAWQQHTQHAFLEQLANGTLPLDAFKYYLIQDYLYLVQFARANALAGYKAKGMEDIAMSASIVLHIQKEMKLHLDYCKGFGLSKAEVEMHEESQACTAYTRYMLEIGQAEDWLALQVALAPCLIGYGVIAQRLYNDPATKREGNPYWTWIENYVAEDYVQAVKTGSELLERHACKQSPSRIDELVKVFIHATKMEAGFWDMASRPS